MPRKGQYCWCTIWPTGVTVDLTALDAGPNAYEVFGDAQYEPLARKLTDVPLNGWGYRWVRLRRGS